MRAGGGTAGRGVGVGPLLLETDGPAVVLEAEAGAGGTEGVGVGRRLEAANLLPGPAQFDVKRVLVHRRTPAR